MPSVLRIAVDGPSGAGKSYLADRIAERFGLIHVDTGALYRAVGLYIKRAGVDPEHSGEVIACLSAVSLSLRFGEGGQETLLNGENVSPFLRTPEISGLASRVSSIPEVRAFLLDTQREIAKTTPVVLDGRDIGTVILPDADAKIYLTASDEVRAKRRCAELAEKGIKVSFDEILAAQKERDARDRARAAAPAKPADDALLLDNSNLSREETVEAAVALIEKKLRETHS